MPAICVRRWACASTRRSTASSASRSNRFPLPATERRRARETVPAHIPRRHMQHPLLPQPPGRLRASWWSLKGGRVAGTPPHVCHHGGMPNRDQVRDALRAVIDPELRRDIVELEMVRAIEIQDGGLVAVTVSLTTPGCPIRNHFQTAVVDAVAKLDGVEGVEVAFDVLSDDEKGRLQRKLGRAGLPEGALAEVKNVICVASGKGGVGKSTLSANLAAALAAEGRPAGALDADVWGYSIPRMLGLGAQRPQVSAERKIVPLEAHGVKVMSIGFFIAEDQAVVWRGPMLPQAPPPVLGGGGRGGAGYLVGG